MAAKKTKKKTKTEIAPKWGVKIFRDAIIGPVKFNLIPEEEHGDSVDPLDLENWQYFSPDPNNPEDYFECNPTQLFVDRENANLFAEGARAARRTFIELFQDLTTEKHDEMEK